MKSLMMIPVAVAVLVLGVVAIGGATAQEDDGPVGSVLSKTAEKLGVSEDELQTAVGEAKDEALDEAVAEGLLTEAQAERIQENRFGSRAGFRGEGPLGFRGGGGHKADIREAAAGVLGITAEELEAELDEGNSLADVAVAQELSQEEFTTQLLAELRVYYDGEVAEGELTQEQADMIFERIEGRIDNIVSGEGCSEKAESTQTSEVTA